VVAASGAEGLAVAASAVAAGSGAREILQRTNVKCNLGGSVCRE